MFKVQAPQFRTADGQLQNQIGQELWTSNGRLVHWVTPRSARDHLSEDPKELIPVSECYSTREAYEAAIKN